ncbi:MAG: NosD domain-containing protein [Candidatus Bathyarchaeia archaeon]|jgi:parallel beta-helix repeat protein
MGKTLTAEFALTLLFASMLPYAVSLQSVRYGLVQNQNPPPTVCLQPDNVTVKNGTVFSFNVVIEDVPADPGMAGVQFTLSWDPTILNAINVTEVMFHNVTPPSEWNNIWALKNEVNYTAVSYAFTWSDINQAQSGGYCPISGNYTLATVTVEAMGVGSTTLHFSNLVVSDPNAQVLICSQDVHPWPNPPLLSSIIVDGNFSVSTSFGTIHIKADGTIAPSTAPIQRIGNYYKLTGSISTTADGIIIQESNITLDGNGYAIQGAQAQNSRGLDLSGITSVKIQNMQIDDFPFGVRLSYSSDNSFSGNDLQNNDYGIWLEYSSGNSVSGNNLTANGASGIRLDVSSDNTICGNSLTNSGIAIWLDHSSNNSVSENNVADNFGGILLADCSNNSISRNTMTANNGWGVSLEYSSNNSVSENNVANNSDGVGLTLSSNNTIYHNNFVNNSRQVVIDYESMNVWDDGYPSGGNYWSNYAGMDLNSGPNQDQPGKDGLGDTPYSTDSSNKDRYPLMTSWTTGDFSISVSPSSLSMNPGESANCTVTLASIENFSSEISLSASSDPSIASVTLTFDSTSISLAAGVSAKSTLMISTTSTTPLNTFSVIIAAIGGGKTRTTNFTVSSEVSLDVPYQIQGQTNWSGPASLSMVLNYYNVTFHSWDYANSTGLLAFRADEEASVADLVSFIRKYYPAFNVKIGNYTLNEILSAQNNVVLADIESNLTAGYPVILELAGIPGHFVVVIGFNNTGLLINDPSGAFFTDLQYGKPGRPVTQGPYYLHDFVEWTDIQMFIQQYEHDLILGDHNTMLTIQSPNANPLSGTLGFNEIHWGSTNIVLDRGMQWVLDEPVGPQDKFGFYMYAYNSHSTEQDFTVSVSIVGDDNKTYSTFEQKLNIEGYNGDYFWKPENAVDLSRSEYYRLYVELKDTQNKVLDYFTTPKIYYFNNGVSIILKESEHHLYLHAYDSQDRHVGLSYSNNETEIDVPDAYYFDDLNGTITVILPSWNSSCRAVVDATFAQDVMESYNLTITTVSNGQTVDQKLIQAIIENGTRNEYNITISQSGTLISVPEFHSLLVLSVFMTATLSAAFVFKKKRTMKT